MAENYWFPGRAHLNGGNLAEPQNNFRGSATCTTTTLHAHNEKSMSRNPRVLSVSRVTSADMIGDQEENEPIHWLEIPATVIGDQSAKICVSLRQLQRRRGCSNALLEDVLRTMSPYLRCLGPAKINAEDKKMKVCI